MHASTAIGRPLSGDMWLVQINHFSCSIRQTDVGIHSVKCLKTSILQQLPEASKLEEGTLWSDGMFSWYSLDVLVMTEDTKNLHKNASALADHVQTLHESFLSNGGIYQQDIARCHIARSVGASFEEH